MSCAGATAAEMAASLRAGQTTPRQLLDHARAQLSRLDGRLNAFLAHTDDLADRQCERAAGMLADDPAGAGPLCGIPIALKDVLCLAGYPTTAGSRILEDFRPPYTATAVQRLLDAGAVPVGKTNCDEFAMGSSTENSAFGAVGNPWDVERVPGGSSGGSAAAVASGMVPISYGTDTGGSIRQPAALTGVVGFKPTYGRVSRYGLIAFASSLDQIGPFAQTVEDAAVAYVAVAGHDPRDSTSVPDPVDDPVSALQLGVDGIRLGIPREYMGAGLEPGVRDRVSEAIAVLEGLGASIEEVSLPSTDLGLSTYYIIAPAECSSNLARYDGVRFGRRVERPSLTETLLRTRGEGFGPEVERRVMLGTYALSSGYYDAYYRRAQKVRTLIAREFDSVFERVDALVCPTSPKVAFTMGTIQDPLEMYLNDALTIPVNLAGLPGISLPCGLSRELPVGLQVIAPRLRDARVFQVARAYEQATQWHALRAPMVASA
ncbi:MAG: Asp-tRNA(Asn)/Glu-tRNA(Gln) amidotransferase subunit GatA [Candidatus Dormibacteraeota bacterium]|uniref:Glutamyl-tRNA(Gln) amidotransferase subunit A n=1 Tax=Candidatus Amunia macphersoniae TaxID=3127014 RepID=A0A934KR73_9BACT|nr:Asp-tRNA(Asn)/Glu-tRNA(Gln) amidotransferase subunit GatA [Candidatus Dormibacteraeota bacterium]